MSGQNTALNPQCYVLCKNSHLGTSFTLKQCFVRDFTKRRHTSATDHIHEKAFLNCEADCDISLLIDEVRQAERRTENVSP